MAAAKTVIPVIGFRLPAGFGDAACKFRSWHCCGIQGRCDAYAAFSSGSCAPPIPHNRASAIHFDSAKNDDHSANRQCRVQAGPPMWPWAFMPVHSQDLKR